MILKAIEKAFRIMKERNYDTSYWAIDIHDTITESNYVVGEITTKFAPMAEEVLKYLSTRKDICLILYTCSYKKEIKKYQDFFKSKDINFQYVNKNPEAKSTGYGCFKDKFYFSVLLDDKAGFDKEKDWKLIKKFFKI